MIYIIIKTLQCRFEMEKNIFYHSHALLAKTLLLMKFLGLDVVHALLPM